MKKLFSLTFVKMLCILIFSIGFGYLLLFLVYLIPLDSIRVNLEKSYPLLEIEGTWPKLVEGHEDTLLDNWTDAVILIETGFEYTQPAYQAALLVPGGTVVNETPTDSFVKLYRQDPDLELAVGSYTNYWHGYLIFMKILMTKLTYGQIRYLNQFLQTALIGVILGLLGLRKKFLYVFPIILTYIFLNPAVVSMSMQYNTMFLIAFIQLLIILIMEKKYAKREIWIFHFFIIGCLTSYFDFLTYPVIGYGLPFILLVSLYPSKLKEDFLTLVKTGISWCFGYVGMWSGKWILGTLLTDENALQQAIERIKYRSTGDSSDYTYIEILKRNLNLRKDIIIVAIIFMLICIIYLLIKKMKIYWSTVIIYGLIITIPFVWFLGAANHSYIHFFFTYRDLAIAIMAIPFIGIRLIEEAKLTSISYF